MADDPFDDIKPEAPPKVTSLDEFRNRPRSKARGAQPNGRASSFFSAAALDGKPVPSREWLVEDLIPARTVTLLSGDGGTGKSLLALQLVVAAALGRPWLGRTVSSGRAVFASAEDDEAELHRRLWDVTKAEGVTFADLDRLTIRSLAGEDALLATQDPRSGVLHPSDLYRELDAFLETEEPTVVVLDTLCELLSLTLGALSDLKKRGIAVHRGHDAYDLAATVTAYVVHLRGIAAGRGGEEHTASLTAERARLAKEQADAQALKNAALRGELVPASDVERAWADTLRKVRSRRGRIC
ncbi:AAA family ATPase [Cereibacter johrii]|uniref:AAA family ATPase n=1 Tax=Cereibacter johrii TaxID=445629 RepID=UPI003CF10CF6